MRVQNSYEQRAVDGRSCRNEGKPIRMDENTIKIQAETVTRGTCTVYHCNTDATAQKGCTGCFPAR